GYIGMGIMGQPMARNLLQAGFELTVWNRTAAKCQPLQEAGASVADSPADLAAQKPEVIFINVTDTADVEAVIFGDDGLAQNATEGLIVVDHSTINPATTQQIAERLNEQGVRFLDAPVSGGDVGAQQGTLSIMVGGEAETFARCKPLLEVVGKSIVHLGPAGMGQACKACNQVAVAGNLLATCEALALARQTGLDMDKMIEVVASGAGGSWQLANLGPKVAAGDHEPGFMVDLILKDLKIVLDTARQHKLPLNGTSLVQNYFHSVAANGGGDRGTQALARVLEQLGNFSYEK
ncbi:MAG: NAD(P)-dependent oxidoreductase, partial [bacterium]